MNISRASDYTARHSVFFFTQTCSAFKIWSSKLITHARIRLYPVAFGISGENLWSLKVKIISVLLNFLKFIFVTVHV